MSKKVSKNSERTSKFANLAISERIQKCRELIRGIKEEKSEKVVINCESIEAEDKQMSKDTRSQKVEECFGDLNVKATKRLDEEEDNEYFGSENVGINENLNNIKHEKEVHFEINLDEIEENFSKYPPKIHELKDIKMEINNKKFKNLASSSKKIGIKCSKNEENSVSLESEENRQNLIENNNSGQENQTRINENVKTEAEKQLLVILPQPVIHKFPIPIKIEDNEPKDDKFKCQICKKPFGSLRALKTHEDIHDKKFVCNICDKKFPRQSPLLNHIKNIHENPGSFKCDICKVGFNTKLNLNAHQKTHDKNRPKPLKCSKCDFATDSNAGLSRHLKSHERIIKRCDKCNKILLRNIIHNCRTDCKLCGKKFSGRPALLVHIKNHHGPKVKKICFHECDICGIKFILEKSIRNHMEKKHLAEKVEIRIQTFTCDLDGKMFKNKSNIAWHMKNHLPPVKCDFCHKKLSERNLKGHIQHSHMGIKRSSKKYIPKTIKIFQCNICSKILTNQANLNLHIRDHNKTIKCKFCNKMFGTQSRLKVHVKDYHEKPEGHICEICNKKFTRSSVLKIHVRLHDPNRPKDLKCSQCDYATDHKPSFEGHLNFHKRKNARIAAIKILTNVRNVHQFLKTNWFGYTYVQGSSKGLIRM